VRVLRVLAPLLVFALVACGMGEARVGKPVSDVDLMQIAEAIIIKHYALNEPANGGTRDIFVGINGKVAPAELLARLSNARVRFRPGNEYKPGLGASLNISNFVWTDSGHAKGDIGEVCGPLCGEGHAVVMVHRDGKWTVESLTPTWIS
jgi:hypothetical protein